METYTFGHVVIRSDAKLSEGELEHILQECSCGADLAKVSATEDGLEIRYFRTSEGRFECIRRITGYLVGTLDRWNNAKQAEEADRVKHL